MKLGVLPRFTRDHIVDPDWVLGFGAVCEEAGVESVWAVEHVVVAQEYEPRYPYSASGRMPGNPETVMPDPLEWLAFLAAGTSTVRLGTSVVVLTLHSPAVVAKRVATMDALSRGRMMLGVGIGWQVEEYAAVGVPYSERGARLDEYIDALRALWRDEYASFDGRFVRFDRVSSLPKPVQPGGVPDRRRREQRGRGPPGGDGAATASSPTSSPRTTSRPGSPTCAPPPSTPVAIPTPSN